MTRNRNRSSVRFADEVAANSKETFDYELEEAATVSQVRVRIYEGPRLDLHITPFVKRGDEGRRDEVEILDTVGKNYVDGDDDDWVFHVDEPLERHDLLGVEVENTNSTFAYNFAVQATLSRGGA